MLMLGYSAVIHVKHHLLCAQLCWPRRPEMLRSQILKFIPRGELDPRKCPVVNKHNLFIVLFLANRIVLILSSHQDSTSSVQDFILC